MKARKSGLVLVILMAGFGGPANAQQGKAPDRGLATYPGPGTNGDYYAISNSFGPQGLAGTYPKYQGYGLSGYGPGAILNEYFVPWPGPRSNANAKAKPALASPTLQPQGKSKPKPKSSKNQATRMAPAATKPPNIFKPMGN